MKENFLLYNCALNMYCLASPLEGRYHAVSCLFLEKDSYSI